MSAHRTEESVGGAAELERSARLRRERDRQRSMGERLARLHHLCLQMTSVAGAAKRR